MRRMMPLSRRRLMLVLAALSGGGMVPGLRGAGSADVFARYQREIETAVNRGLEFLLSQEDREDSTFPQPYGRSTGISSLVGLAILATGQRPGVGRLGEALNRRCDYAIAHGKENGLIEAGDHGHGPMYAHNISTLFLSELSGFVDPTRQEKLGRVLAAATKIILEAQAVKKDDSQQGGWRYFPNSTDSDLSCSGWALMSLRSAKLNGAPVPEAAIQSAVKYIYRRQHKRDHMFGYQSDSDHSDSLTGMAILSLALCGRFSDESLTQAADWVLANFKKLKGNQFEFYGNYYNAQAMFQLGGKYWETYASWMYPNYLELQKKDGRWEGTQYGPVYSTAMMVLAFSVPYRQLPIYQRDEQVDEGK
jgi:hypothetical protein